VYACDRQKKGENEKEIALEQQKGGDKAKNKTKEAKREYFCLRLRRRWKMAED
jgi:hypothetical protein